MQRNRFRPHLEPLEARTLLTIYTVTNTDNTGSGSLRRAIQDANGHNGVDAIVFNIPGAGVHTISPNSALPDITDPVAIDGYTQLGSSANTLAVGNNAVMLIEISGANMGSFDNLFWLKSITGCTIRGLVLNRSKGNAIYSSEGGGHVIEGNFVGTNVSGTAVSANFYNGIDVAGGSGVTIGGTTPAARNVFSGNGAHGVYLSAGATGNFVQGNYIGSDKNGTAAIGNALGGVTIEDNSDSNSVGGSTAAARNLITGNALGVSIFDAVSNTQVQGNYIGTDATGTIALGNGVGIAMSQMATANTIGGSATGTGNLISGNTGGGVWIIESGTTGNILQGNYIGTNASGTSALGNGGIGVEISLGATGNTVGGTTAAARNIISGNGGFGVFIGDAATTGNQVQGNYIGTDGSGAVAVGNAMGGVGVFTSASGNTIGGTAAGAGNRIAFNNSHGVQVDTGTANAIRHNAILSNSAPGITLTNGGNNSQSAPSVNSASSGGGATTILITLVSTPSTTFNIDVFSSAVCDPSGFGEGEIYHATATLVTKSTGRGRTQVTLPTAVPVGHFITATATSPTNNTSPFSKCREVSGSTAPNGDGPNFNIVRLTAAAPGSQAPLGNQSGRSSASTRVSRVNDVAERREAEILVNASPSGAWEPGTADTAVIVWVRRVTREHAFVSSFPVLFEQVD